MIPWQYEKVDRRVARDVGKVLPEAIFDAHAHLYRNGDLRLEVPPSPLFDGSNHASVAAWKRHVGELTGPDRLQGGLFFPFPSAEGDLEAGNRYIIEQLKRYPQGRGLMLVAPETPQTHIEEVLEAPGMIGFKPYHVYSGQKPTFDAPIHAYLPDTLLEIADKRGLVIMLHLVKGKALADPENQQKIRLICAKYPQMKLILAHAARGFHGAHTAKSVGKLRGITNLWFDTSGICEAESIRAILETFGPKRLLWGTDFPISHLRGKAISLGEGFFWILQDTVNWEMKSPATTEEPTLVGLESIRALLRAIEYTSLGKQEIDDIFRLNAMRLFNIQIDAGHTTQELYQRASERIPGGVQLLSKKPEMMAPGVWPAYFSEARGCETWDLDGRHYFDMGTNGIGSCLLGFGDPDVNRAVKRAITLGSMSTLNPAEEVELADQLCEIHPWAEKARFARTGGETAAMAVRIARSATDRSHVAVCGYHGWHDWYLAANLGNDDGLRGHLFPGLNPYGVPRELRGTVHPFQYNDVDAFTAIVDEYGDRLAAVVMEPCRYADPEPGFLETIRRKTTAVGALLIFDEITIGFRLNFGGAHLSLGVDPDMAVFAKALGNGYPIGAVIGTAGAMEGAGRSFISSTYNTERLGPTAALATLKQLNENDIPGHVAEVGNQVMEFWRQCGIRHGLPVVTFEGYPCLAKFHFDHPDNKKLITFYTQLMLERGFLCGAVIYPTMAHNRSIVNRYGEAIDNVFAEIASTIDAGSIDDVMRGPTATEGFRRLL